MKLKMYFTPWLPPMTVRIRHEKRPRPGDSYGLMLASEAKRIAKASGLHVYGSTLRLRVWAVSEPYGDPNERETVCVAHLHSWMPPELSLKVDGRMKLNPAYRVWMTQYVESGADDLELGPGRLALAHHGAPDVTVRRWSVPANPSPLSRQYGLWYEDMVLASP